MTTQKDFDQIFNTIGDFEKYQWYLYFVLGWTAFTGGINSVGSVFIQYIPDFHCNVGASLELLPIVEDERCPQQNNDTISYSQCTQYNPNQDNVIVQCVNDTQKYYYDEDDSLANSLIKEFDLVCDPRKYFDTIISMLFFLGFLLGGPISGYISDNYGRKKTIIIGTFGNAVFNLSSSGSSNWWTYAIFRFLVGMFGNIAYVAGFVYIIEVIGPKHRATLGIFVQGIFAVGYGCLSIIAVVTPYWRHFQIVMGCVPLLILVLIPFLYDSPGYYLSKKQVKLAIKSIIKIGRKNGRILLKEHELLIENIVNDQISSEVPNQEKYSFLTLFQHGSKMTLLTLNLMFNWFVNSVCYYGLSLNSAALPTNLYVSNALYAIFELPSYVICSYLITVEGKFFGRRGTLAVFLLSGGVCCILSTILTEIAFCDKDSSNAFSNPNILASFILSILGKFFVAGSFSIAYIITAEAFPTMIRSNAVGACTMIARIGGILTPAILALYDKVSWLPGIIFGVLAVVAGVLTCFMPETLNQKMLTTFEEADEFYNK